MQSLWAECDISVSRVLPIFSRFRFRRFGLGSWDIGFGTFSLKKKRFDFGQNTSLVTQCLYGVFLLDPVIAWPFQCFEDLIGVTLVDEDADSKVVDVSADIKESIGNSFVTSDSLTTMFLQFYDDSK